MNEIFQRKFDLQECRGCSYGSVYKKSNIQEDEDLLKDLDNNFTQSFTIGMVNTIWKNQNLLKFRSKSYKKETEGLMREKLTPVLKQVLKEFNNTQETNNRKKIYYCRKLEDEYCPDFLSTPFGYQPQFRNGLFCGDLKTRQKLKASASMGQLITYCNMILYLSNNGRSVVYGYLTDIGRIIFIRGRFEKGNRLKWTKSPTLDFLNKSETITEGFKHWLSLLLKTSRSIRIQKLPRVKTFFP